MQVANIPALSLWRDFFVSLVVSHVIIIVDNYKDECGISSELIQNKPLFKVIRLSKDEFKSLNVK